MFSVLVIATFCVTLSTAHKYRTLEGVPGLFDFPPPSTTTHTKEVHHVDVETGHYVRLKYDMEHTGETFAYVKPNIQAITCQNGGRDVYLRYNKESDAQALYEEAREAEVLSAHHAIQCESGAVLLRIRSVEMLTPTILYLHGDHIRFFELFKKLKVDFATNMVTHKSYLESKTLNHEEAHHQYKAERARHHTMEELKATEIPKDVPEFLSDPELNLKRTHLQEAEAQQARVDKRFEELKAALYHNETVKEKLPVQSSDPGKGLVIENDANDRFQGTKKPKVTEEDLKIFYSNHPHLTAPPQKGEEEPITEAPAETDAPTDEPTDAPVTKKPKKPHTDAPTDAPTDEPTDAPVTKKPKKPHTDAPTDEPTDEPTDAPTGEPTDAPVTKKPKKPTQQSVVHKHTMKALGLGLRWIEVNCGPRGWWLITWHGCDPKLIPYFQTEDEIRSYWDIDFMPSAILSILKLGLLDSIIKDFDMISKVTMSPAFHFKVDWEDWNLRSAHAYIDYYYQNRQQGRLTIQSPALGKKWTKNLFSTNVGGVSFAIGPVVISLCVKFSIDFVFQLSVSAKLQFQWRSVSTAYKMFGFGYYASAGGLRRLSANEEPTDVPRGYDMIFLSCTNFQSYKTLSNVNNRYGCAQACTDDVNCKVFRITSAGICELARGCSVNRSPQAGTKEVFQKFTDVAKAVPTDQWIQLTARAYISLEIMVDITLGVCYAGLGLGGPYVQLQLGVDLTHTVSTVSTAGGDASITAWKNAAKKLTQTLSFFVNLNLGVRIQVTIKFLTFEVKLFTFNLITIPLFSIVIEIVKGTMLWDTNGNLISASVQFAGKVAIGAPGNKKYEFVNEAAVIKAKRMKALGSDDDTAEEEDKEDSNDDSAAPPPTAAPPTAAPRPPCVGWGWQAIETTRTRVTVTHDGSDVYAIDNQRNVWRRNSAIGKWTVMTGSLDDIVVSGDGLHLWGLLGRQVWYRRGQASIWTPMNEMRLTRIAVSHDGMQVYGINEQNRLVRREGALGKWTDMGPCGPTTQLAVSGDGQTILRVSDTNQLSYRIRSVPTWNVIPTDGGILSVAVNRDASHMFAVFRDGRQMVREGVNGKVWGAVQNPTKFISAALSGDGMHVWGLTTANNVFHGTPPAKWMSVMGKYACWPTPVAATIITSHHSMAAQQQQGNTNIVVSDDAMFNMGDSWVGFCDAEVFQYDVKMQYAGRLRFFLTMVVDYGDKTCTTRGLYMVVKVSDRNVISLGHFPDPTFDRDDCWMHDLPQNISVKASSNGISLFTKTATCSDLHLRHGDELDTLSTGDTLTVQQLLTSGRASLEVLINGNVVLSNLETNEVLWDLKVDLPALDAEGNRLVTVLFLKDGRVTAESRYKTQQAPVSSIVLNPNSPDTGRYLIVRDCDLMLFATHQSEPLWSLMNGKPCKNMHISQPEPVYHRGGNILYQGEMLYRNNGLFNDNGVLEHEYGLFHFFSFLNVHESTWSSVKTENSVRPETAVLTLLWNGNLALIDTQGSIQWQSNTAGSGATVLRLERCAIALYKEAPNRGLVWSQQLNSKFSCPDVPDSKQLPPRPLRSFPMHASHMEAGDFLLPGQSIISDHSQLIHLPDGNVVLYDRNPNKVPKAHWATNTSGTCTTAFHLSHEGTLGLFACPQGKSGQDPQVWSTGALAARPKMLDLDVNCTLNLYAKTIRGSFDAESLIQRLTAKPCHPINGDAFVNRHGDSVAEGETLIRGQAIITSTHSLLHQPDGDIVFFMTKPVLQVLWRSDTKGTCTKSFGLENGNLVLRNCLNSIVWKALKEPFQSSDRTGMPIRLRVRDGTFVMEKANGDAVWNNLKHQAAPVTPQPIPETAVLDEDSVLSQRLMMSAASDPTNGDKPSKTSGDDGKNTMLILVYVFVASTVVLMIAGVVQCFVYQRNAGGGERRARGQSNPKPIVLSPTTPGTTTNIRFEHELMTTPTSSYA